MSSHPEFVREEAASPSAGAGSSSEWAAELVKAIKTDYTRAKVNEKDRALLDFVWKLAADRTALARQDLEGLRTKGFTEHQILDIVLVAALAEFANCLVEGIGFQIGESLFPVLFGE
ncbi:MAG: hypothetical protein HY645_10325 [Acidobacteria bacterium]|nr:hypothetical protein [Acidobacteriota bacterium]